MDEKPPILACRRSVELVCDDCSESPLIGEVSESCDEVESSEASLPCAVNALRSKFDPIKFGAVAATNNFFDSGTSTILLGWQSAMELQDKSQEQGEHYP